MQNENLGHLKNQGNDLFLTKTNNTNQFKKLVANGYIAEVNNILFVYDQSLELFTAANANYAFLAIPNNPRHERLWSLSKVKKTLFGSYKASGKILPNTFQISKAQMDEAIRESIAQNLEFKDIYEVFKDPYNLPIYKLD